MTHSRGPLRTIAARVASWCGATTDQSNNESDRRPFEHLVGDERQDEGWDLPDDGSEDDVLRDLAGVGVVVRTVWGLHEHRDTYPAPVPVLLHHLARDHPRVVLKGIGNALAHPSARPWWPELRDLYLKDRREVARERLAVVLSSIAVREHYEDLVSLLGNEDLGRSRILLVRAVNKIGNRLEPGAGRAVIAQYAEDPQLGTEVTNVLKGRSRSA